MTSMSCQILSDTAFMSVLEGPCGVLKGTGSGSHCYAWVLAPLHSPAVQPWADDLTSLGLPSPSTKWG